MMALKDDADFDLLINYTRRWDEKIRPFPPNAKWVTTFKKGVYDFALLNIDQQCSNMRLNKAVLTTQLKKLIQKVDPDLPIVFINHGTPVYPETYLDGTPEKKYVSEVLRKEILDIVGDSHMVVNSHQAVNDWGRGYAIIHGMDKDYWEFSDLKEARAATFISAAGIGDRYYNRSFLVNTMDYLKDKYGISLQWINVPGNFRAKNIGEYKFFLSRTLIYFNPTYASPMPRSRTEAMFSGCCIITTRSHDAEKFIIEGHNGFFVPHDNAEYAGDLIAKLLTSHYKIAKEVGKNARETAVKIFSRDRYRKDWINYINNKVLKKI